MMEQAQINSLFELLDQGKLDEAQSSAEQIIEEEQSRKVNVAAEFHEVVTVAKRRKALLAKFSGEAAGVKQIRCASCGLAHRVVCPSTSSVSCYACGTTTDVNTLASLGRMVTFKPSSFLKVGLEGTYGDQKLQIIGIASYYAKIREWDSEDRKYEHASWRWVEYSLMKENGEICYLCVDHEGYGISSNFVPQNPQVPTDISEKLNFSKPSSSMWGGGNRIIEWGDAKIDAAQGEFSWTPDRNESINYAEYKIGRVTEGVEWRSASGKNVEAEFYRVQPISYKEILEIFKQKELLDDLNKELRYRAERTRWAAPFFIVGLLFLLWGWGGGSTGTAVIRQTLPSLATLPDEGELVGPFQLKHAHSVHRLRISSQIPDNSDIWAGIELLDETQDPINTAQGDFWRESGYDDGYYSESDLVSDKVFYLTKPGIYYLRVYGEQNPNKPVDGSIQIEVFEGATASNPYIWCGILALIVGTFASPIFRQVPKLKT